jgi:hypothetical protein
MADDILELFDVLDLNSTPLTDELLAVMLKRARQIASSKPPSEVFWNSPSFNKWSGLVQTGKKKATDRRRAAFLAEWHSTLQQLRDIGNLVSKPENRPSWVDADAPAGAQGDQFLHAHYYQRTFDGRRALYTEHFERNKKSPDTAVAEAISWWRSLSKAPWEEDVMLNSIAPMLREALTAEAIEEMGYSDFHEVCMGIHSIKDYARRVANKAVGLREDGTKYTIPEKVDALSKRIWGDKSAGGNDVKQLLKFILYGGSEAQLPERLWIAVHDPKWKIEGLGISALGELVGWALPDRFPPRNGRTSKSLKALGYDVTVHVG